MTAAGAFFEGWSTQSTLAGVHYSILGGVRGSKDRTRRISEAKKRQKNCLMVGVTLVGALNLTNSSSVALFTMRLKRFPVNGYI